MNTADWKSVKIEFHDDMTLAFPDFHDAHLSEIRMDRKGGIELCFRNDAGRHASLSISEQVVPCLWSAGMSLGSIVSVVSHYRLHRDEEKMELEMRDGEASRFRQSQKVYSPAATWALMFETNFGDTFAISGKGDFSLSAAARTEVGW